MCHQELKMRNPSQDGRRGMSANSYRLAALYALVLHVSYAAAVYGQMVSQAEPDHAAVFYEVWQLVKDNFYDGEFNGVDWDQARHRYEPLAASTSDLEDLSRVINDMLGELRTSHTRFYTRFDLQYYELLDVFRTAPLFRDRAADLSEVDAVSYEGIGIYTTQIDGHVFIKHVLHGSPADGAGLKVGDRVISVDGKPWHPVTRFATKAGQNVTVRVQRTPEENSVRDFIVPVIRIIPHRMFMAAMKESARMIRRGRATVGYVRIWSYAGEHYHELLLEQLHGKLHDADALILDLRDGWGGANPNYLNVFNKDIPLMTMIRRDGTGHALDSQWRKPVVLLVNEGTRSGKEVLAHGFRKYGYGKIIGTRTGGAVTAGRMFPLGDDAMLYLAIADVRVDGERLEGKGVEPDIEVPFRLPYADGEDPQLDKAIDFLIGQVKSKRATNRSNP